MAEQMSRRKFQYIINRFLVTVEPLPPEIDTSEDRDVHHSNWDVLFAIVGDALLQNSHGQRMQENNWLTQDSNRREEQISSLAEQDNLLQLLVNNCNIKLQQAEQINKDLRFQINQLQKAERDLKILSGQLEAALDRAQQTIINTQQQLTEIKAKRLSDLRIATIVDLSTKLQSKRDEIERLVSEKKALQDENTRLKSALNTVTSIDETRNLIAEHSRRFKISKPPFECTRCHQAFDSQTEMETSVCRYHDKTRLPTGTTGLFYYKCCDKIFGKSPHGCMQGKHTSG
ncbi:hypothetical protein BsWGS_02416 [Bradybaena similaris]